MNSVQIFKHDEFGELRKTDVDGRPYFVGADVARALGYKDTSDAIRRHCRGAVKRRILTNGGIQWMNVIPKGDVYRLAANSELPGAEKFESWIFDEVLVSVDDHGAYLTPAKIEEVLLNPDTIINLATQLKAERRQRLQLEAKVESDAPKVLFASAVEAASTSILVGELAKVLRQNGIEIGQNRLFDWLRGNGYLIRRKGTDWNMPTQRSMELGLFTIKETTINRPDGSITISKTVKVTGKGQTYFVSQFLAS